MNNKIKNNKDRKGLKSVLFLVILLMAAALTLSSCGIFKKRIPQAPEKPAPAAPAIRATEVIDMILGGAKAALDAAQGNTFNIDGEADFEVSGGEGLNQKFNLKVKAAVDLDKDADAAGNVYSVELTKFEDGGYREVFNLYYKDSLSETPYIYVGVGGEKHAVKFFSVKELTNKSGGAIGKFGEWTTESLFGALPLGEYTDFINVAVRNFLLDGAKSIFKAPYISADKSAAGFEIDVDNLKGLIKIGTDMLAGIDGISGTFDQIMDIAGVNLSFEGLLNAVNNIPDMEIKVDAGFDKASGKLLNLGASVKFLETVGIEVDLNDGGKLIDFEIENGRKFSFALTKLNATAGAPIMTELPSYVDTDEYIRHSLINFEINGTVRLEAANGIDADGNKTYGVIKGKDYILEAKFDLDPFVLLNGLIDGINRDNIEEILTKLGKFNIIAYQVSDTGSRTVYGEIAFDPANTGNDGIYVGLRLQGLAAMTGEQTMKFDLTDLLDWLNVFGEEPSANGGAVQTTAENSEQAASGGLDLSGISSILQYFEIIKNGDVADFGIAIYPLKMDFLGSMAEYLLDYGGERIFVGIQDISYGTVDENYNAFEVYRARVQIADSFTLLPADDPSALMTEYKYGQPFQGGYSTVDVNLTYINKGSLVTRKKSLGVIEKRGFDTFTPGKHTVTLYMIMPPELSSLYMGIYNAFKDGGLPYGLVKYTYEITVLPPEESLTYSLTEDNISVGGNIFDKNLTYENALEEKVNTERKIDAFTLYTMKSDGTKGGISNAMTYDGIAKRVGKYVLEIEVGGKKFTQYLYIHEVYIPDLPNLLIYGNSVDSLSGRVSYYSDEAKAIVTEVVKAVNGSNGYSVVDLRGANIIGSGLAGTEGLTGDASRVEYRYKIGSNGATADKTQTFGYTRVKYMEATYKFFESRKSSGNIAPGDRIDWFGKLARLVDGEIYQTNTDNYGSGIVWSEKDKHYMIFDKYGNVIADKIEFTIRLKSSTGPDVTDEYFDKETGRLKAVTGKDGLVDAGTNYNLYMFFKASYKKNTFELETASQTSAEYTFTYQNTTRMIAHSQTQYRTFTSGSLLKANFLSIHRRGLGGAYASVYMKFDVEAGKYCFPDFNLKEKAYLDFKFYERGGAGNESKLIAGPYFNSSGAVLLPAGIYDAVVSTTVDGVYAEMKCTKGSEITITAARVWTGKVGEKLTPPSSGDNRNVYYVIPSTGVFDYYYVFLGENGYHVGGSLTSIIAPIDIKILDADGNEITDALDENYILSDKIAAGTYTIVITVHYQGTHQESLVSLTVTE